MTNPNNPAMFSSIPGVEPRASYMDTIKNPYFCPFPEWNRLIGTRIWADKALVVIRE